MSDFSFGVFLSYWSTWSDIGRSFISVSIRIGYIRLPNGEPTLPNGMRELLKADLDKSFDF